MDEDDEQGAKDRQRSRTYLGPRAVGPTEVDARLPHGKDRERGEQHGLRDPVRQPFPKHQPDEPAPRGVRMSWEPPDQREGNGRGDQAGNQTHPTLDDSSSAPDVPDQAR